jgi:hypothetical protein
MKAMYVFLVSAQCKKVEKIVGERFSGKNFEKMFGLTILL